MYANDQLRRILERGCANLKEQVEQVGRLLHQYPSGRADAADSIAEAQALTHQIKGTSGSIGFKDLATAATALDDNLKHLVQSPVQLDQHQLQISNEIYARLQAIASETTCEKSLLYDVDIATLANS